jgi:5-(carboxyamino)imidazole ribonucleotide synthase
MARRDPQWSEACALPDVKLHLYGKRGVRPGRKMGHLTALAETPNAAMELVREARRLLTTPQQERQAALAGSTLT